MGLIPTYQPKKVQCKNPDCERMIYLRTRLTKFCSMKCKVVVNGVPKRSEKAKKPLKRAIKSTGELKMFNEIWNERPHVSELTGEPLLPKGHIRWHWQFAHVLNKGRFPSMRLRKDNILLCLPDEQMIQDRFEIFTERKEQLLKETYKK